MKTRDEILGILSRLKRQLGPRFKIKKMGLFGSYARGEQTAKSDVDVVVDIDPEIGLAFVTLADTIEEELGISTDVVSLRAIKPRYLAAIGSEIVYV